MKCRVVDGDDDMFMAMTFGRPSDESIRINLERVERFKSMLNPEVTHIMDSVQENILRYRDDDLVNLVRNANERVNVKYRENIISVLRDYQEIADAPVAMRRWIVANPRLASLAKQQRVELWGAGKDFIDSIPDHDDPYHRAIHNSELVYDEESGETYSDYEYGADTVDEVFLRKEEQLDLLIVSDRIDDLLDQNIDPTSPLGEEL